MDSYLRKSYSVGDFRTGKRILRAGIADLEKRYRPSRHYVYVIEVTWSDGTKHKLFRKYSEFFELDISLQEIFPHEFGKYDSSKKIIPSLPSEKKKISKREIKKVAAKRKDNLNEYCIDLVKLDARIAQHPVIVKFFQTTRSDISPPSDATIRPDKSALFKSLTLGNKKKNGKNIPRTGSWSDMNTEDGMYISGPISMQTYRAIADYKAAEKGEVNLVEDQFVDIVEKHDTGWWFVQTDDQQGWAPASYLQAHSHDEQDEPLPLFNYEQHLVMQSYDADLPDEVTITKGALVNVMHKLLDGWWIVHHNGQVGYAPATYLTPYHSRGSVTSMTYLDNDINLSPPITIPVPRDIRSDSIKKPTQRRCTIKSKKSVELEKEPEKDLVMYRKMSVKMSQRQKAKQAAFKQQRERPSATLPQVMIIGDSDDDDDDDDDDETSEYMNPDPSSRDYVNSELIEGLWISKLERERKSSLEQGSTFSSERESSDSAQSPIDEDWEDFKEYYNLPPRASRNRIHVHRDAANSDGMGSTSSTQSEDNSNTDWECHYDLKALRRITSLHPPHS